MVRIDDLLGVRFTSHGRNASEGFDCYGLAIEVSKRFGHELVDLWYKKGGERTFTELAGKVLSEMGEKLEVTNLPFESCLIVFYDGQGNMVHIGVMLDEEKFIHADTGGVMVVSLEDYHRKNWRAYKWRQ